METAAREALTETATEAAMETVREALTETATEIVREALEAVTEAARAARDAVSLGLRCPLTRRFRQSPAAVVRIRITIKTIGLIRETG